MAVNLIHAFFTQISCRCENQINQNIGFKVRKSLEQNGKSAAHDWSCHRRAAECCIVVAVGVLGIFPCVCWRTIASGREDQSARSGNTPVGSIAALVCVRVVRLPVNVRAACAVGNHPVTVTWLRLNNVSHSDPAFFELWEVNRQTSEIVTFRVVGR